MGRYLSGISGLIPNTNKSVTISLNGRNLIIAGGNGSGKTSFLNEVYRKLELLIIKKKLADLPGIQKHYEIKQKACETVQKGTSTYQYEKERLDYYKNLLDDINHGLDLEFDQPSELSENYERKFAVIRIFGAGRLAKISHADTARGLHSEAQKKNQAEASENFGNSLEQHLVNLRNRRALALTEDNDVALAETIRQWFVLFDTRLKELMEDESCHLVFDSNTLKFTIRQKGKPNYTFQTLSSGYLAIFDIYADLLMRSEYFKITPEKLQGVVLIDEIDAHLHVSLQRLILPFLTKSFPGVQFLVTTHSPFVLMSAENSVVYDLGKCSQIDDSLSFYTYSSVMEGILGTKVTSVKLEEAIEEVSKEVNSQDTDYARLKLLIDGIRPAEGQLDSRSKAFYLLGLNAILDHGGQVV